MSNEVAPQNGEILSNFACAVAGLLWLMVIPCVQGHTGFRDTLFACHSVQFIYRKRLLIEEGEACDEL